MNVLFLNQANVKSPMTCAAEICRHNPAPVVLIMVTSADSEQELVQAVADGADEAVSSRQEQIVRYPYIAARAVARRNSVLQISGILDWMPDPILISDEADAPVAANAVFTTKFGQQPAWAALSGNARRSSEPVETTIGPDIYRIYRFPIRRQGRTFTMHLFRNCTELRQLTDRLRRSERLASIGTLVSGVGHDINNPLTGTIAYAELLDLRITDFEAKQDLRKIIDSAERCKKILDNLLSFAREQPLVKSIESLNDLIDRTIELRGYRLRSKGISIEKDYGQLPAVFLDAQLFQQVILSLLANAEQAISRTEQGPGKIVFTTRFRKEGRMMVIRIADNGPGLPDGLSDRIFDPCGVMETNSGSWFSLALARDIIVAQGGTISAGNDPAGGAFFAIELPTGALPVS